MAANHNQLIFAAASDALNPLGCVRLGRSRTWVSDQRYWLITVEFQPSGWSKGSYLNVGATWLWHIHRGLSFHHGHRIADFVAFESAEQFEPLIARLAARAANEVMALRLKFRSMALINRQLIVELSDKPAFGPIYRAAVAAGCVGDASTARRLFDRLTVMPPRYGWEGVLQADAARLAALGDDPTAFRSAVISNIRECRALNGLPTDPRYLAPINSIFGQ